MASMKMIDFNDLKELSSDEYNDTLYYIISRFRQIMIKIELVKLKHLHLVTNAKLKFKESFDELGIIFSCKSVVFYKEQTINLFRKYKNKRHILYDKLEKIKERTNSLPFKIWLNLTTERFIHNPEFTIS